MEVVGVGRDTNPYGCHHASTIAHRSSRASWVRYLWDQMQRHDIQRLDGSYPSADLDRETVTEKSRK